MVTKLQYLFGLRPAQYIDDVNAAEFFTGSFDAGQKFLGGYG